MIIKTDEEKVFVNLDVVDAVVASFSQRDYHCFLAGGQAFEVTRPVADAILDALEKRTSKIDRIQRMAERLGHAVKAQDRASELRRILDAVLKQWSADTAGLPDNQALWKEANELIQNTPAGPPEQVTA